MFYLKLVLEKMWIIQKVPVRIGCVHFETYKERKKLNAVTYVNTKRIVTVMSALHMMEEVRMYQELWDKLGAKFNSLWSK